MAEDIRDKPTLSPQDIHGLNFIRVPGTYIYRRHYRAGLRSHIMEVLDPRDVARENKGVVIEGMKYFPRAKPLKMLRLFRTKFHSLQQAHEEATLGLLERRDDALLIEARQIPEPSLFDLQMHEPHVHGVRPFPPTARPQPAYLTSCPKILRLP